MNIIGNGFVGSAFIHLLKTNNIPYQYYDTNPDKSQFNSLSDMITHSEQKNNHSYYIICVPTPSLPNGDCDISIISQVIHHINTFSSKNSTIIIKSTVKPGTCSKFQEYSKNPIVFCPEFLKENSAQKDMYNSKFILFGTADGIEDNTLCQKFREIFKHNTHLEIITLKYEYPELFKYTLNTYLALKITYFNEIYNICEKLNIEYDQLKQLFHLDPRIGSYGITVPGLDGKFSFGGSCLPKESRAMSFLQKELELSNDLLQTMISRSNILRDKKNTNQKKNM